MAAPNIKEIENGIYELEHEESSKSGYALLAALYTCRNEMLGLSAPQSQIAAYAEDIAPMERTVGDYGGSEFLQAVAGKDPASVWAVIDELMDTLRVVNLKAYDGVMRKINRL